MKYTESKLIAELVKNSRRSDRELAKAIGVSQPTVSRNIKKLENEGILGYGAIPNLAKLGYEILAVSVAKWNYDVKPNIGAKEARDFMERHPSIIFASAGNGLNSDRILFSVHKSFADYSGLMDEIKMEWAGLLDVDSFLIDLKNQNFLRDLSFRHLMNQECMKENEKENQLPPSTLPPLAYEKTRELI